MCDLGIVGFGTLGQTPERPAKTHAKPATVAMRRMFSSIVSPAERGGQVIG